VSVVTKDLDGAADTGAQHRPAASSPAATTIRVFNAAGLVVVLGAAIAFGYSLWPSFSPFETTDNAYIRGDLTFVGTKVAGYISEVATENNRRVARGDILARIDPRDFEAAARDAEATLAQQAAAEQQVDAQVQLQQAQIEAADANVAAAVGQAAKTAADFDRARDLVGRGFVSRSTFGGSTADNVRAQAGVDQARALADVSRKQLGVLSAQKTAIGAAQLGAQARLLKARNDLAATVITAPREGLVAARNVRIGEYVGIGTRLMAIAPTQGLWIEANLRETQIARVHIGDRVEVRVDAAPGRTFCGIVESMSGASGSEFSVIPPDNATGNFTKIVRRFPVRILFDAGNPDLERLATGMSVEPRIAVGSHEADFKPDHRFHCAGVSRGRHG
jgi:membrane fusion protein (multidrug efflux system)